MKDLLNSLKKINNLGITNRKILSSDEYLYGELFLNIDHFITDTVFHSRKNTYRLPELARLGVEKEDIHMECLKHCIEKMDLVLKKDLNVQLSYLYTMCNNVIIDSYRKAIKMSSLVLPLTMTVNFYSEKNNSKKSKCLEDYLFDKKTLTESHYISKEELIFFYQKYCKNADTLLCKIAHVVFQEKNREIAELLDKTGSVEKALSFYHQMLKLNYHISEKDLPSFSPAKTVGLTKILNNPNHTVQDLSKKISNILNRTK